MSTLRPLGGKILGVLFGLVGLVAFASVAFEVVFEGRDRASASVALLVSLLPILIGILAWKARPLEAAGAARQRFYPKFIKAVGIGFAAVGVVSLVWSGAASTTDFLSGRGVGRSAFEFLDSPLFIFIGWHAHRCGVRMSQRFAQPDA